MFSSPLNHEFQEESIEIYNETISLTVTLLVDLQSLNMSDPGWTVIQKPPFAKNLSGAINNTTGLPPLSLCDLPQDVNWQNIVYACAMIIILLASVIGNSLVVLATIVSKAMRKRVTIYFIVSLACSDLFLAVFMIPFHISEKFHHTAFCHNLVACYVKVYMDVFCNVASILSLFLIALDRFIAIKLPFRYQSLLSCTTARVLTICVWLFSMIWALMGLFEWTSQREQNVTSVLLTDYCMNLNYYYYLVSYFVIFLVPLAVMTVTYFMILKIALSQIRTIESYNVDVIVQQNNEQNYSKEMNAKVKKYKKKRKLRKELKATKSVAIVYFAFLLCWFPNCVINFIVFFNPNYFSNLKASNELSFYIIYYTFLQFLPMINTITNPVIYSFSNKQFRKAFKLLYKNIIEKIDFESSSTSSRRNTRSTIDGYSSSATPRGSRSLSEIKGMTYTPRCSKTQADIFKQNTEMVHSIEKKENIELNNINENQTQDLNNNL